MTERRTVLRDYDGFRRSIVTDTLDPNAFTVIGEQDITEILASIARDREISQAGKDVKKLATLPAFVYEDLERRGVTQDPDRFDRWLNSSAAREWKIWEGSI